MKETMADVTTPSISLLKERLTSSKPCKNRDETVQILSAVCSGHRPSPKNVTGPGPLLVSDIPQTAKNQTSGGVILGIDEAGRGPVLGPMTYAAAYWHPTDSEHIPKGFTDSKQLSATTRTVLFSQIQSTSQIGFVLRVLHASEISRNMLRKESYNLNAMSHDSAIQMIWCVLDAGVKIDTCYIDTVGIADSYRRKLEREFEGHGVKFVVEKKADAKYAPCSAASVGTPLLFNFFFYSFSKIIRINSPDFTYFSNSVAKVSRDAILESWQWSEPNFEAQGGSDFGSGYPSDPKCKNWMDKNLMDPVFCFPDLVRFSWGPAKKAIEEGGVKFQWEADDEENDEGNDNQMSINSFMLVKSKSDRSLKQPKRKKPRLEFFENMKMSAVTTLVHT